MYNFGSIPFFASNTNLISKNPTGIPICIVAPSLYGDAIVESILSVIPGDWNGRPEGYRYSWYRDNELVSNDESYRLIIDDFNTYIKCVVTAVNSQGSTSVSTRPVLIT